jgi:hypothetical protein
MSYRDGIFSKATPASKYQSQVQSYGDGSLGGCSSCVGGLGDAGIAYRDGVFSRTQAKQPYGAGMRSFSDGSLGALDTPTMLKYGVGALVIGGVLYALVGKKKMRKNRRRRRKH